MVCPEDEGVPAPKWKSQGTQVGPRWLLQAPRGAWLVRLAPLGAALLLILAPFLPHFIVVFFVGFFSPSKNSFSPNLLLVLAFVDSLASPFANFWLNMYDKRENYLVK